MAEASTTKKSHKEWRKEAKKQRRKRIRQKLAEERNKKEAEEEEARKNDPTYQTWLREQEELEAAALEQEQRQRQEQEELWLRRELIAQRIFREQKRKHEATLAAKEAERQRIQKEFDELQLKAQIRREERKRIEEQAKRDHEKMMAKIAQYIEIGGEVPEELTSSVQSNPNKQICPFFSKTNACRFKMQCCRNHIRPKLSKILFFPNFFSNIKLEQSKHTEYGADINLEWTEQELYEEYTYFFHDVVEELKKFGEIENFRTCMNTQAHLRGNVLVEYKQERDALRAYMNLQGRYYASRRINVEFSAITSWKSAICGLSYTKKCPKGKSCNFMHPFRNPGNTYNTSIFRNDESVRKSHPKTRRNTSVLSWNDADERGTKRHWRWSESPEPDKKRNRTPKKTSHSPKTNSKRSSRSKPRQCSTRLSSGPRSRRSRSSERQKSSHRSRRSNSTERSSYYSRSRSQRDHHIHDQGNAAPGSRHRLEAEEIERRKSSHRSRRSHSTERSSDYSRSRSQRDHHVQDQGNASPSSHHALEADEDGRRKSSRRSRRSHFKERSSDYNRSRSQRDHHVQDQGNASPSSHHDLEADEDGKRKSSRRSRRSQSTEKTSDYSRSSSHAQDRGNASPSSHHGLEADEVERRKSSHRSRRSHSTERSSDYSRSRSRQENGRTSSRKKKAKSKSPRKKLKTGRSKSHKEKKRKHKSKRSRSSSEKEE